MSIRDVFIRVLRNQYTSGINFTIHGTHINRGFFSRVASAAEGRQTRNGRLFDLHVIINPGIRSNTALRDAQGNVTRQGISAAYDAGNHAMVFADEAIVGMQAEALAVHEAVHAGLHLQRIRMSAVDGEAAAYIAQCIYFQNAGMRALSAGAHRKFVAAWRAASAIRGGNALTVDLLREVRAGVLADPLYRSLTSDAR